MNKINFLRCRWLPLLVAAGITAGIQKAAAQSVNPYLQAVTPSSIAINWKTAAAVTPLVRYGTTSGSLTTTLTGTTQVMNDVGYSNNYFYHTLKLAGLTPDTKYYYRVVSGNDSSEICSFKTLPVPGNSPSGSGKLRFLILGDNQIKSQPRYDSLMVAARRKLHDLYGPHYNDSVSFILNMGDQVDVGTLDHYENVHLAKSKYLSPYLPIFTAVGNHETYGTLKMQAYYDHFVLDSMNYKGIYSGSEDYYAFQAGNVVIAYLNTENTSAAQFNWVKRVVDSANADPAVKWIVTIAHRPYQAEQYVGDISPWIRNTVVPYCMQSPKYFLHVGAHHHLYARGQMKDVPAYNVISGGTAWDQYWGMASEQNFDDVQKTISNWAYQLVEFDMVQDKADVTTFSIGSIYQHKENVVIDSFHRYRNQPVPLQPAIAHNYADSVELPLTLSGSAFASPAGELLNSTEFQIAAERTFSVLEKSSYRHFEDLFGKVVGANPDTSKDQNLGVNIQEYTLPAGAVGNGWHYVRVRYRDRNQSWSAWSATDSFKVFNSVIVNPTLALDSPKYSPGSPVNVTFANGVPNTGAWIGIYKRGQSPGTSTSTRWQNTNGARNGTLTFNLTAQDEYYVAYFGNSGYTEVAPRVPFYYGVSPVLTTTATNYAVGQTVPISYSNAPGISRDWIGVYKIGMTPGGPNSIKWTYVSGSNGLYNVTGLDKGYYFASYFIRDQYFEASPRVFFAVGDTITTLTTNKTQYNLGEYIAASWIDGPGNPKDWLGVYHQGDNPNVDTFISYTYIDGQPVGSKDVVDSALPTQPGNYFLVLFTNDSYNEVSNRVTFEVMSPTPLPVQVLDFKGEPRGLEHYLYWRTESATTGDHFILQHSGDGKTYKDIYAPQTILSGSGDYTYAYNEPTRENDYYRVRMVAADGHQGYSKVVHIHQNEAGENQILVYPNPVQQSNRSIIESPYPIDQIDILDMSGQLIYQSKNIQKTRFSLLHQDLPPGTYLIRIHAAKVFTVKMIVNN